MSSNPTTHTPSAPPSPGPQSSPPAQSGGGRLIVLLVLLVVAIAALAYDYLSAGPGIAADDKKIEAFVDETNRQGVAQSKRITPDEIHKLLGRQPTSVEKHPDDHYEIEYYCKWGLVPVLNMRRHYLAIVYVGDEPRRYNSHYKNERPPVEALPIPQNSPDDTGETAPPPTSADPGKAGESAMAETPDAAPAEGAKKRKGKKKQDAAPDEKPAEEKQADVKQEEKQPDKKSD